MHSPRQLESAFYIYTSKDKNSISELVINLNKILASFARCLDKHNCSWETSPEGKRQDSAQVKIWSSMVHWQKKKIVPRYFKFQLLNKPKRTSCMTILMEIGIKKATSKAARSQLLIDTTQVPEAHSEIGWQVMQCTELTHSVLPTGHETEQKLQLFPAPANIFAWYFSEHPAAWYGITVYY